MAKYKTPIAGYENQCVGLLLEKLGVVTFDYDIEGDVLLLAKARDGMQERHLDGFCRTLCTENRGMVHPDSVERLVALFRGQTTGVREVLLDMAETPQGRYSWYEVAVKLVRDETGRVRRTIGILWDIESSMGKMEQSFSHFRSERDSVTGVLNGSGLEKAVQAYLAGHGRDESNVLMRISFDNLHQLAQQRGKHWTDQLLVRICKAIGSFFRAGDVLAHLGDGQFAVFVKDMERTEVMDMKARAIRMLFGGENTQFGGYGLVCRIAVAYYPEDGRVFHEILETAEKRQALASGAEMHEKALTPA
ncbi:GGDEF domain-containing protein [Selenomonas sp.]|uniref:GGDEF domain-containing protein n=1 Tax=Selenomonas sp. TaxID=2053611 RepID=UPI003FA31096